MEIIIATSCEIVLQSQELIDAEALAGELDKGAGVVPASARPPAPSSSAASTAQPVAPADPQFDEIMKATIASYDASRQAKLTPPTGPPGNPASQIPLPPTPATQPPDEDRDHEEGDRDKRGDRWESQKRADRKGEREASEEEDSKAGSDVGGGSYYGFRNKQDASEVMRRLLREHAVSSTSNWSDAVKALQKEPLWQQKLRDIPDKEKRQIFNAYKTLRAKEEKVPIIPFSHYFILGGPIILF